MTVSSSNSVEQFNGDGSQTQFSPSYLIFDEAHIDVYVDDTLQTLNSDYTVANVGEPAGFDVNFSTAPANNTTVTIRRSVPLTQETDYIENDSFPAETHERALDLEMMAIQQLRSDLDRTPRYPIDDPLNQDTDLPSKSDRSNKFLAFDADGKPIAQSGTEDDTDLSDKLVDPVGGIGQQRLDVLTADIDNLKALVDATALQVDGLQVQMRAFYSDNKAGGGIFFWDDDGSFATKADADGGTIVDPDNVGTLSATSRGDFLSQQGTGTGNGVWVRIFDGVASATWFGDRLDGTADSAAETAVLAVSIADTRIDKVNQIETVGETADFQQVYGRTGTKAQSGRLFVGDTGHGPDELDEAGDAGGTEAINCRVQRVNGVLQAVRNLEFIGSEWSLEKDGRGSMLEVGREGVNTFVHGEGVAGDQDFVRAFSVKTGTASGTHIGDTAVGFRLGANVGDNAQSATWRKDSAVFALAGAESGVTTTTNPFWAERRTSLTTAAINGMQILHKTDQTIPDDNSGGFGFGSGITFRENGSGISERATGQLLFQRSDSASFDNVALVGKSLSEGSLTEFFAFRSPTGDDLTALEMLVQISGTKSIKRVQVGAADSGGTGFRQLIVPN